MGVETRQVLVAAIAGLLMIVTVVPLSRRGQLSFRYTIGWIFVASVGVLGGSLAPFAEPLATLLGLSTAALLAFVALVFVTMIAIQLSISISGLQKQLHKLAQEIAYYRHQNGSLVDRDE